jgi:hypothetical protein
MLATSPARLPLAVLVAALAGALALLGAAPAHAVGGGGGNSFSIQCAASEQLASVQVRAGNRIDALGITCTGPGGTRTTKVGGNGGSARSFLDPDQWIDEVRGWTGKCGKKSQRICALRFAARRSLDGPFELSPQYGKHHSGADDFVLKVPAGRELYGFAGRAGNELDAIELLTRPRNAGDSTRRLSVTPFVQALNIALGGSDLRLHNLGERHGDSWLREDDSWVSLFGATQRFTLPETSYRRKRGLYRHYFYANDVNATKADVATSGNAFVLRINFEGSGHEIKGLCRRKKLHGYGSCPGRNDGDGNTPDVDWKDGRVDVTLLPIASGGELRLNASAVNVRGDFQLTGVCGSLEGECKKLIGDWELKLRSSVEDAVRTTLNQPAARSAQSALTRPLLRAAGITAPLVSAGLDGSTLVVTY